MRGRMARRRMRMAEADAAVEVETPLSSGVRVEGVTKTFDGITRVLAGVDVDVESAATLALLGPSGCGKTTLLRIVAGLERPDGGTVHVGDQLLSGPKTLVSPEHRRVGMVFQDWALFPHLSVARNVGFGLERPQRRSSPRIDEALALVGLSGMGERMPSTLSGGQQQRVALARAIAPRPSVLLLDEPFSNLDASLRSQVRTEIHQLLVELGITTIFVTHDQDEAFVLGDRVAVMHEGRVVQLGPPAELYQRPATRWLADFVGDANFVTGSAGGDHAGTPLGRVRLRSAAEGPVDVLIRPEEIALAGVAESGGADSDVGLLGEVELVEFVGHDTTYVVRAGELRLHVRRASMPVASRGDRVRLRWAGEATTCFPAR